MDIQINNPAIINDLIKINNDRIEGYKDALTLVKKLEIRDLDEIFRRHIAQSEQFVAELSPYVRLAGKEPSEDTMISGKLFRLWMSIKVSISGNDRKSLLESCEKGEDAFKESYQRTLAEDSDQISVNVTNLIRMQLNKQLDAYNTIKVMRENELDN
ncbi:ferritin-like domain-containing protein [Sphingobacterium thalpophilum]|uniref:ferritin-like domain-containing protein n=1 Tax=Sphingobacterium thalpophilum TaxID=259 RepID=UPI0024A6297D|nr:PA2169 family four-helix-bundle protein [Sphingobacterium thalpophilum]